MPIAMTGVQIDESHLEDNKEDVFEKAWREHAGDAEDLADLPEKSAAKEKLPIYSKEDANGELGDSVLSRAIDEAEFKQQITAGLVEAEDAIADLEAHYSDLGNLSDTLELFCTLVDTITQDPVNGFGRALEALSGGEGRTRRADAAKGEAELAIDPRTGKPFPTASLDRRIERTMNAVERGNHKISSDLARRVCKAAGVTNFADALRLAAKFNRDALARPFETLQQLAHAKGAPATPRQLEAWQHNEGVKAQQRQEIQISQQQIDQFANARDYNGQLAFPYFQQLKTPMASFLQSGAANNLQEAYALAVNAYSQPAQAPQPEDYAAHQQIGNFATDKDSRGQLKHPLFEQLRPVMQSFLQSGMADNLQEAYALASQPYAAHAEQTRQASVEKARRAIPVRSNSGPTSGDTSSSSRGGLDAAIERAMAGHSFD